MSFFYIYIMNKIFGLLSLMVINSLSAQFKVEVEAPKAIRQDHDSRRTYYREHLENLD